MSVAAGHSYWHTWNLIPLKVFNKLLLTEIIASMSVAAGHSYCQIWHLTPLTVFNKLLLTEISASMSVTAGHSYCYTLHLPPLTVFNKLLLTEISASMSVTAGHSYCHTWHLPPLTIFNRFSSWMDVLVCWQQKWQGGSPSGYRKSGKCSTPISGSSSETDTIQHQRYFGCFSDVLPYVT